MTTRVPIRYGGTGANNAIDAISALGAVANTGGVITGDLEVTGNVAANVYTESGYPLVSQSDIGTGPNEIPLNQYLGSLAYQDADSVNIGGGVAELTTLSVSNTIIGSITGNAVTATALQTARTIGGVSFNGTANINLPGVNQVGNQNTTGSAATLTTTRTLWGQNFNGSANVSGALTGVTNITANGTISAIEYTENSYPLVSQSDIGTGPNEIPLNQYLGSLAYQDSDSVNIGGGVGTFTKLSASDTITGSVSGNAATATALQTARTIGGVSFDGTSNINLPGVNVAGNQNTTGSAATLTTSRTLWGQSFDGSGNVSGNLTSVGNITGTAGVTLTATSGTLALAATGSNIVTVSTNGSERLRLDAAGNLGLGVTPSAWDGSLIRAIQIGDNNGSISSFTTGNTSSDFLFLNNNAYYSTTGWRYAASSTASQYTVTAAEHRWSIAPSGTANDPISFTQAMTLDASGRLGIGETSPSQQIHAKTSSTTYCLAETTGTGTSAGFRMKGGASADYTIFTTQGTNQFAIFDNAAGVERARITADGNLGIGTTSPENVANYRVVETRGSTQGGIFQSTTGSFTTKTRLYSTSDGGFVGTASNHFLVFLTNDLERLRIGTDGVANLFVTNNDGFQSRSSAAAGNAFASFVGRHSATTLDNGTISYIVWNNGDVENTNNSYGAISDRKLKEDIIDASSQWDDIKSLRVRKFRLKDNLDAPLQIGVIAQEAEQVSPGLIYESPDRDQDGNDLGTTTKAVKYSVLYMKAIKALQEAMARIEDLEAEVATLKAQP